MLPFEHLLRESTFSVHDIGKLVQIAKIELKQTVHAWAWYMLVLFVQSILLVGVVGKRCGEQCARRGRDGNQRVL